MDPVERLARGADFPRRWVRYQGLALALWLPWAVPFVIQTVGVDREFWLPSPGLRTVWSTFREFNFALLPGDLPLQLHWMLLYGFLVGLGIAGLRRSPQRVLLLLALLLVPILLALLVSLRRPVYHNRTFIWSTLPYYLLMATGIRALSCPALALFDRAHPRGRRTGGGTGDTPSARVDASSGVPHRRRPSLGLARHALQVSALGLILVLSGLSLRAYYFRFEKEAWDQAAEYVGQNAEPEDLIVFHATWVQIPFEYYYRHYPQSNELRGLPVDLFERGVLEPKMADADIPYLHELIGDGRKVWLVYSHDWYTDPEGIIPREITKRLQERERRRFAGLQVIRYADR